MYKGETVISAALAAVVVLTFIAIESHWRPASLKDVASSAEEYILKATGIRGEAPDIVGYNRLKSYRLPFPYRAGLYRSTAASLGLATGRFVIYDRSNRPLLTLITLEGLKEPWTQVYDFAGRNGLPNYATGGRPTYTRDLTGDGHSDLIVGQFSGGSQCCTVVTVVELIKETVRILGRIEGIESWPFTGLELRRLKAPSWQLIVHRSFGTACGSGSDGADVPAIYNYVNGRYNDRTSDFTAYLQDRLRREVARWARAKSHTVGTLQTITAQYAALGQTDQAQKFFSSNLGPFLQQWKAAGADPTSCEQNLANLTTQLASNSQ